MAAARILSAYFAVRAPGFDLRYIFHLLPNALYAFMRDIRYKRVIANIDDILSETFSSSFHAFPFGWASRY